MHPEIVAVKLLSVKPSAIFSKVHKKEKGEEKERSARVPSAKSTGRRANRKESRGL